MVKLLPMAIERQTRAEKKSIWDLRLFKGGLVVAGFGAVLGIGVVVELGAIAVAGSAVWYWVGDKKAR